MMPNANSRSSQLFWLIRPTHVVALFFLSVTLLLTPQASAISDDESKTMLTKFVHSYYDIDPESFWNISTKFKNQSSKKLKDVRRWLEHRLDLGMTYLKVKGIIVTGNAKITKEKLDHIDFRFDGSEGADSRIIVVTAFVHRTIKFDDSVRPDQRTVAQEAVMKIYVTLVNEELISYRSDEINLGYEFIQDVSAGL